MSFTKLIVDLENQYKIKPVKVYEHFADEVYWEFSSQQDYKTACLGLHNLLKQPVASLFALDQRQEGEGFKVITVFMASQYKKWIFVQLNLAKEEESFPSLSKDLFSSHFFERKVKENFGLTPLGNPDLRRFNLHEEVWPQGYYPLRKDFLNPKNIGLTDRSFQFIRGEGLGMFEVPVGPVHAGIIGPGHFRFSVAGEPIINLEIRLGFTHRGVEKHFEGKTIEEGLKLAQCVVGDMAFAHSLSYCQAIEKLGQIEIFDNAKYLRVIFLELERMYNHANDIGGMAIDVSFSFPASLAQIIKENILALNFELTESRYLKGVNIIGGVSKVIDQAKKENLKQGLKNIIADFYDLEKILINSLSFMDRVESTGILKKKTAFDLGVKGLAARACGLNHDLRRDFSRIYDKLNFAIALEESGDVLARLKIRLSEFKESYRLINLALDKLTEQKDKIQEFQLEPSFALGYSEGWRGPVLYWLKLNKQGVIDRCAIFDPSIQNWQGLAYSVLGDIIPDFPLCNKSFDLSYAGNDL